MTVAMRATTVDSGRKALRIGMIRAGNVMDERLIRASDVVSVGNTERSTFVVRAQEAPAHHELFPLIVGAYKLHFTEEMEGRVALGAPHGVKSLRDLRESGVAARTSVGWQIALSDESRGKVSIGDVQFLFQFVLAPPPPPRSQLPAAIRAGWVKSMDWGFDGYLSFFLLFALGGLAYVEYLFDPVVEDVFALDTRTVQLAMPAALQEPSAGPEASGVSHDAPRNPATQAPPASRAPDRSRTAVASSAEGRTARAPAQASTAARSAERAAQAAMDALQNSVEFAAITGATGTEHKSAGDRLASGGIMAGSVNALANAGRIETASGNGGVHRGGLVANAGAFANVGAFGQRGLVATREVDDGAAVTVEWRIVTRQAPTNIGSGEEEGGDGRLDAGRVAVVLRTNLSAIRSCYERSLRNHPALSGRLTLRFAVGSSGRVTGSPSTSGLSSAPEVGSCVLSRVRGFVFPAPEGGAVEVSFPFDFQAVE
jgi:hypothetical protein